MISVPVDNLPNIVSLSGSSDGSDHHSELEPSDKTSHHDHDDGATTDGKLPWGHDEADYPYGDWNTSHYNYFYVQYLMIDIFQNCSGVHPG